MNRAAINAYFTRKQREVLTIKQIDLNHFQIIRPPAQPDQSPQRGAMLLSEIHGWTTSAIARAYQISWFCANRLIEQGHDEFEQEIAAKIDIQAPYKNNTNKKS